MFLAYGFQRTTMDDIARAAEMSRPAVYLHFRNKMEIFREIAEGYAERLVGEARQILAGEGSLGARVGRMFELCFVKLKEEMAATPHGADLLNMKDAMSADVVASVRRRISAALTEAIEAEVEYAGDPSPQAMADILLDAFEGAKERGASLPELRTLASDLGRLVSART